MGNLLPFPKITTPDVVFTDVVRWRLFTQEIESILSQRYDEDTRDRLVCFCRKAFREVSTDELVKLVDNPVNEDRWRGQPLRYAAMVSVLAERFLAHD